MKVRQVSEHIWAASVSLVIFPVAVWLVAEADDADGGGGVTLVDAGLPFMAKGILRAVDDIDAGPLRRILLTHGHPDHTGAIAAIRRERPVPVFAHRIEIPYLEGRLPYPGRRKATTGVEQGVVQALREDEAGVLAAVGELEPYLTPGHAPGHVVYHHVTDDVLLAGDLFTSRRGRLRRPMPMFTSGMATAVESALVVDRLRPRSLEVAHGGRVLDPARQLDAYLAANRRPRTTVDPTARA